MNSVPVDDPERLAMARPWRQRAWERVPGWAKIGLRALFVVFVVNVALVIRIWYGLQDPPEVAAIRGPGRHIIIPATNHDFRNPLYWLDAAPIGLRGVSANDVTAVRLDEHATDELVAHIARHFPNVQSLYFSGGNITAKGLLVLKRCPQIYSLEVSDTDIEGLEELLPHLPDLRALVAMNTNLGDEFIKAASKHEVLEYCALDGTNITPEAVETWKGVRPKIRIQTDFGRVVLRGLIRWSDGKASRQFIGPYELGRHGPQLTDGSGTWSRSMTTVSSKLYGHQLRWAPEEFKAEPDGRYQIRLRLGNVDAEPADFVVKDGVPAPDRLEIRMPITRAEAERIAVSNGRR